MKTVVIYKTISGFTKKYAEWIAEELGADLFSVTQIKAPRLDAYDAVVYGGSLHAVGVSGAGLIRKNLRRLAGKKVAVFAVGASPVRDETTAQVRDKNFTQDELRRIRFFYLRGGFDFSKLNFPTRIVMSLMKRMLQKKKERTQDEQDFLDAFDNPADYTDRESIKGIVEYMRGL